MDHVQLGAHSISRYYLPLFFFVKPQRLRSTFPSNTMEGQPVILSPEGTILPMIALGGVGGIHQNSNAPEQVIKTPLKHNVQGCTQEVIGMVESTEEFSNLCINREKLIYQTLPKDPNILNCIAITERGIHFPYLRQGNVRQYLQKHSNS